jgi:mRNA-degrading endonuclease YafQ of YafQ-DinJ toxin-antitoxin module
VKRPLLRSSTFVKAARRLVRKKPWTAPTLQESLQLLSHDAFNPLLRTHKLKGRLAGTWACSAGFDLRIVFEFVPYQDKKAILLLTVGTHEEVY